MTKQFKFTGQGRRLFLDQLKTLISHTETDADQRVAYRFSNAVVGDSGYSIGIQQFDLGSAGNATKARTRLAELGFTGDEIARLTATPSVENPVSSWSARLSTEANRRLIDGYADLDLKVQVGVLEKLINYLNKVNPSVADDIMGNTRLQLRLIDYDNQFTISGLKGRLPPHGLLSYMSGNVVNKFENNPLKLAPGEHLTEALIDNYLKTQSDWGTSGPGEADMFNRGKRFQRGISNIVPGQASYTLSSPVTTGALAGATYIKTVDPQSGQISRDLHLPNGSIVRGTAAFNGNISFGIRGSTVVFNEGRQIASFDANGNSVLIAGGASAQNFAPGQLQFDSNTGRFTSRSDFHYNGVRVAGLQVTATGNGHGSMAVIGCAPTAGTSLSELLAMDLSLQIARKRGAAADLIGQCSRSITTAMVQDGYLHNAPSLEAPRLNLNPIGAYYESSTPAHDRAESVAGKTLRIVDSAGAGVDAAQLAARDTNGDGRLSGIEMNGLKAWRDWDEDGMLSRWGRQELSSLHMALFAQGQTELRAQDYALYTAGNARYQQQEEFRFSMPGLRSIQPQEIFRVAVPNLRSNYARLRHTENRYVYESNAQVRRWIDWQPGNIKINKSTPNSLVGTEGNDSMDAANYAAYLGALARYFNLGLLTHFYAGGGNDTFGGSERNDTVWGGTGDDALLGYAGNDTLYGEEGNDELQGGAGDDTLEGGEGDDRLFGQLGNDTLRGGLGNDTLVGFAASNDAVQTLSAGETDDDRLHGGAGDDLILGGLGHDVAWGGDGNDEVQGGAGHDAVYGEAGADKLFGGAGDDVLYGGDGDDVLAGFTGTNEAKQTLDADETDNDFLYGGAGSDTLLGGLGNDYLDGGAGADRMEGGQGNDIYIVNSVNDVILEHADQGHDTVLSAVSYQLNSSVEDLHLLEGGRLNGTGNRLNNCLIGNRQDNILDGVTGADRMQGGQGNDIYCVDNVGDEVVELANQGSDTVHASISYRLGAHQENLVLLDFSKAELGKADGRDILVYGYPKAFELDYMQGNAVPGYAGTCALTAIANLATQAKIELSEAEVVQSAITNQWARTDPSLSDYQRGGSNYLDQQALLDSYGLSTGVLMGYNARAIANLIRGGRGVILALNAGSLWGDDAYRDQGGANHVVTITGVACDAITGEIAGFYMADSGRGKVSDMTRYVAIADFQRHANVSNAYALYTMEPIKLWDEDLHGTGNDLDNRIIGNRGDNRLEGGRGNDVLIGGAGNDTYVFSRGDGADTVVEVDSALGNVDAFDFQDVQQSELQFWKTGGDLLIQVADSADQVRVQDWFVGGVSGTDHQIECIKTSDGLTLSNTDVDQLVQAMSAFAPTFAGHTQWRQDAANDTHVPLVAAIR